MIYLKFEKPESNFSEPDSPIKKALENFIVKTLIKVFPDSNPDLNLDKILYWKIEFDEETNITDGELGFNENDEVIYAAPFKKNYGFWTDNHLTLKDYERFNPIYITKEEFEKDWLEFTKGEE
ncbi:MAG: hypothetical protein V4642_13485 [Bacteroidota bacterium]